VRTFIFIKKDLRYKLRTLNFKLKTYMYITEIIWLTVWPVLIWGSYKLSALAINKYEEK
jgi:hypothetical protein